jgi:WD40 repeat protein
VTTAKEVKKMVGHNLRVSCVAFGPEGKAISGAGDTAILWDLATGNKIAALSPDSSSVYSVAYSAKAGRAAIGGQHLDRSMRAWNLETREARLLARQPSTYGVTIGFSPDGGKLVALDKWSVRIHDAASGKELKEVSLLGAAQRKNGRQPLFAALAPDGQWAVTGDFASLSSWDLSTGKEHPTARAFRDFFGAPTCVAFLPNGRRVACAAVNGTVHIFRVPR